MFSWGAIKQQEVQPAVLRYFPSTESQKLPKSQGAHMKNILTARCEEVLGYHSKCNFRQKLVFLKLTLSVTLSFSGH